MRDHTPPPQVVPESSTACDFRGKGCLFCTKGQNCPGVKRRQERRARAQAQIREPSDPSGDAVAPQVHDEPAEIAGWAVLHKQ